MGRLALFSLVIFAMAVQVYGNCRYVWRSYQKRVCCNGWGGCYCHIALCNPQCTNGGRCQGSPQGNVCSCPRGRKGAECEILHCGEFELNCYPGTCTDDGSNKCVCIPGFGGDDCNTILDRPEYKPCKATLQLTAGSAAEKLVADRCFVQDGPDDRENNDRTKEVNFFKENATFYSNAERIQSVQLDWEALLAIPTVIPIKPYFVREVITGLVSSNTQITLQDENGNQKRSQPVPCKNGGSIDVPRQSAQCRENVRLNWPTAHGYTLKIERSAIPGGFKEVYLALIGIGNYRNISYTYGLKPAPAQITYVKFDRTAPYVDGITASFDVAKLDRPVTVDKEFTVDGKIDIKWSINWRDDVAGMGDASYDVYRLGQVASGAELAQQGSPVCTGMYTWMEDMVTCTPVQPGFYSVVSRVADKADNYRIARALAVIGPTPGTLSKGEVYTTFFSPDASAEAGYRWITTTNSNNIKIRWEDHFKNDFLTTNQYLGPVQAYTEKVDYDDVYGNLQYTGTKQSVGGIKQFRMQSKVIQGKGDSQPDGSWAMQGLNTEATIPATRKDGDTIQVWVRAIDLFDDDRQDLLEVYVDSSPPTQAVAASPPFETNVEDSNVDAYRDFASRVRISAEDPHSGIGMFEFRLIDLSRSGEVVYNGSVRGQECAAESPDCYSIDPMGLWFPKVQALDLNNCWFKGRDGNSFRVEGRALNRAYLGINFAVDLAQVSAAGLSGIDEYPGVKSLNQMMEDETKATIGWDFPQACYDRKTILVEYTPNTGPKTVNRLDPDTRNFTLTDLPPGSEHDVNVIIIYIGDNGNEAVGEGTTFMITTMASTTSEGTGMSGGTIFGIILGVLILLALLAILILMFVRYRRGQSPVPSKVVRIKDNIHNRFSTHFTSRNNDYGDEAHIGVVKRPKAAGVVNPAYDLKKLRMTYMDQFEDEVYAYGAMEFNSKANWVVAKGKVKLGDEISSGRFARIRHAKVNDRKFKGSLVAKVLKDPDDEANKLLMTAKMNFLATGVTKHPNLVNLVAAVPEDPILLLEFCDYNLKTWLSGVEKVTPEVAEQLLRFCLDIAKGLRHLHNHEVLHRRLAARNVLLVVGDGGELQAKVTGFGPMKGEGDDPKKEKIPVKWLAPESLEKKPGEQRIYSKESDMWTYGIVVWEIFSLGEQPYQEKAMTDMKLTHASGYQLPKPDHSSEEEYATLMTPCWSIKPGSRPSAKEIVITLNKKFDGTPIDDDQYMYGDEAQQDDQQGDDPLYFNIP